MSRAANATCMPSLVKSRARAALKPLPAPTMRAISGMRAPGSGSSASVVPVGQQRLSGVARGGAFQRLALQFDHHRLLLPCAHQAGIDVRRRSGREQTKADELRRVGRAAEFSFHLLAFEQPSDVAALEQRRLERQIAADALQAQSAATGLRVKPADNTARQTLAARRR